MFQLDGNLFDMCKVHMIYGSLEIILTRIENLCKYVKRNIKINKGEHVTTFTKLPNYIDQLMAVN